MAETMSIRAFAKNVAGVSEGAIRKAIKKERIVKGYVDGKIVVEIAKKELGIHANISTTRSKAIFDLADGKEAKPQPNLKETKPKDKVVIPRQRIDRVKKKRVIEYPESEEDEQSESTGSFEESNKIAAKYKAKILKLEYEEKQGESIKLSDLTNALYALGVEIRTSIMNVGEKVIDNVLASSDRTEALNLLNDELAKALHGVANLHNKEFKSK
jgi:hypothetical protein